MFHFTSRGVTVDAIPPNHGPQEVSDALIAAYHLSASVPSEHLEVFRRYPLGPLGGVPTVPSLAIIPTRSVDLLFGAATVLLYLVHGPTIARYGIPSSPINQELALLTSAGVSDRYMLAKSQGPGRYSGYDEVAILCFEQQVVQCHRYKVNDLTSSSPKH